MAVKGVHIWTVGPLGFGIGPAVPCPPGVVGVGCQVTHCIHAFRDGEIHDSYAGRKAASFQPAPFPGWCSLLWNLFLGS